MENEYVRGKSYVLEFWDDPYDFILHDHVCPTHQLQMALIRARPIE